MTERDETKLGHVIWHCSDEDGGSPDVGISIGMGDGKSMWIGEVTNRRWDELDIEQKVQTGNTGHGWWLMFYPDGIPLAKFADAESARQFSDEIEALIRGAVTHGKTTHA